MLAYSKADLVKPVASTSASLNPYEVGPSDPVNDAKIRSWLATVDREMAQHRSPFVAAEVILSHLDEYATQVKQPDQIYLATTLAVLRSCVPQLSPEFRDIATAAIHEIIPAISFTHGSLMRDLPAASSGNANSSQSMAKSSYSECFLRVFRLYRVHASRLVNLSRRDESKEHLMDRVVQQLDAMWTKMCFLTWRIHCKKLREKKIFFQRLVKRGIEGRFIHLYVRSWRTFAHKTIQAARITQSNAASKELERLYPLEQEAKNLHERATEEMREKMRLLEESNQRCHEARLRLESIQSLLVLTEQSLREHWWTWQACVRSIFTDPRTLPKMDDDDESALSAFEQNITDTAAKYNQRARARTNKTGLKQIVAFLEFIGHLTPTLPGWNPTSGVAQPQLDQEASRTWAVELPSSRALTGTGMLSSRMSMTIPTRQPSLAVILTALTNACRPVATPLHPFDYLHANQSKLTLSLSFLAYACSGGHCSLFTRPLTPSCPWSLSPTDPRTNTADAPSGSGAPPTTGEGEAVPVTASGTRMVEDVSEGLDQLHDSTQYNDRYLLTVRRCLATSEMDLVQDCVGRLFQRWSLSGLPLDRQRLEAATHRLVTAVERPVVTALYPTRGIHTLSELLNYLTSVAEFTSMSLLSVADRLEFDYVFEPEEVFVTKLHDASVTTFTREHSAALGRFWTYLRAEDMVSLSFDKTKAFLLEHLMLEPDEVDEIWQCGSSGDTQQVAKEDFEKLLLIAGEYINPSPFVPAAEKLAQVVDGWLSAELQGVH